MANPSDIKIIADHLCEIATTQLGDAIEFPPNQTLDVGPVAGVGVAGVRLYCYYGAIDIYVRGTDIQVVDGTFSTLKWNVDDINDCVSHFILADPDVFTKVEKCFAIIKQRNDEVRHARKA
jgi:hypothetical protein